MASCFAIHARRLQNDPRHYHRAGCRLGALVDRCCGDVAMSDLDDAIDNVRPSALAHALAAAVIRRWGRDKASTFADAVVREVQMQSRKHEGDVK